MTDIMNNNIEEVIEQAEMIVNGYAFLKCDIGVRIIKLNDINKVTVFLKDDSIFATSMDEIEASIVKDYYMNNKEFLGDEWDA